MKGAVSRSEELSIIGDIQGTMILAFPGNSITEISKIERDKGAVTT